jgi:hypothetical protein
MSERLYTLLYAVGLIIHAFPILLIWLPTLLILMTMSLVMWLYELFK